MVSLDSLRCLPITTGQLNGSVSRSWPSVNLCTSVLHVVSHPPTGQPKFAHMEKTKVQEREGRSMQDHIQGYRLGSCILSLSPTVYSLKQLTSPDQSQRIEKQIPLKDQQSHIAKGVGIGRPLIRAIEMQSIYHSHFGQITLSSGASVSSYLN